MYDRCSLTALLCPAGFDDETVYKADESANLNFKSYCPRHEVDGSVQKPGSPGCGSWEALA